MKKIILNFILVFVNVVVFANLSFASEKVTSAGCLINTKDGILFVQDSWTRRLSLPGGASETGEKLTDTAIRETFEETGIRAKTVGFLGRYKNFNIYECVSDDIQVLGEMNPVKISDKLIKVSSFNSLHYNKEIIGSWIVNKKIDIKFYRFPEQIDFIESLKPKHINKTIEAKFDINLIHQNELKIIKKVQNYKNDILDFIFKIFYMFGSDKLFFILLPLLLLLNGKNVTVKKVIYVTILSLLINMLFKTFFALPRPFDFNSSLQYLKTASGFGLPSGNTQLTTTFWLSLALFIFKDYKFYILAFVISIMTGLSRTYFGLHFYSDIIVAWGLSIFCIYAVYKINDLNIIHWLFLSLFSIFTTYYTQTPETLMISMILIGFTISLIINKDNKSFLLNYKEKFVRYIFSIIILLLIVILISYSRSIINHPLYIILLFIVSFGFIGLALGTIPYKLIKK